MATGGTSGTYYAYGGVLCQVLGAKLENTKLTAVSTGASKENIQNIGMGNNDLGIVQNDVMAYAYQGTNTFEEDGAIDSFSAIAGLYAEQVQLITVDDSIKSVDDLKGKKVSIGAAGSGVYYNAIDIFAAYDMTEDDIQPQYLSFSDSAESLKDGKIDAAFVVAGAPTTAVTDLATTRDVNIVSIDDEHIAKLTASCPYYTAYTIPAGTYNGLDEDAQTVTVKATLIVSDSVDDDTVYNIIKNIFESKDEITTAHAKGEELDLTTAADGISIPFHPGAAKYFEENGITVPTK
jgi:TRAP transporter TAXI family solute receptor